jgi:hypothetical protein
VFEYDKTEQMLGFNCFIYIGNLVTGEGTSAYTVTIPGTISIASGTNTMSIVPVSDPNGSGALVGGTQDIYVGGTLTVGATQPVGTYSGTFNVTVNYN